MTVRKNLAVAIFALLFSSVLVQEASAGTWRQGIAGDSSAWWYDNGNGTFPKSTWMWLDGNEDGVAECYYFDDQGRMLSNTVTPDGYAVDENGAWMLGFVRRKYILNSYQTELFRDAAQGLLYLYENQFYTPSNMYLQLRSMTNEDRQILLNTLLSTDAEKHLKTPGAATLFVPLRTADGIGYFDREKTLNAYEEIFGIELDPEQIPQSEYGELMGIPDKEGIRYRITGCEQDSDGTFLYLKLTYEKTDAITDEVLRTGTFYMELFRKSGDMGFSIDIIGNYATYG